MIDNILQDLNEPPLAEIEDQIDRTLKPASRELKGWRIQGETDVRHVHCEVKNVAAILPGEGPLADEAIVLGAHYDHLGYGSYSTLPSKPGPIYHGADDNASGDAVVLEVARALAQRPQKLRRTVVFILFTGEEWGFWGSMHYVNDPIVPMGKTAAMINLDMVGRLRDDALTVNSVGTGTGFSELLDQVNRPYGFHLTKVAGASGRSDQASFYAKRVPNIHFFTGKHPEYHRPSDTFDKVNIPGMRRIAGYVYDLTVALADAPQRPQFVAVPMQRRAGEMPRPFLGCIARFHPRGAGLSDQRRDRRQSGRPLRPAGRRRDREVRHVSHRHLRRFRRRLAAVRRRRSREGPGPPQQFDDDLRGHAGRAGVDPVTQDGLDELRKGLLLPLGQFLELVVFGILLLGPDNFHASNDSQGDMPKQARDRATRKCRGRGPATSLELTGPRGLQYERGRGLPALARRKPYRPSVRRS